MTTETQSGVEMIAAERRRQIATEGWTQEHDAYHHSNGELAHAAAVYALTPDARLFSGSDRRCPVFWPVRWAFKPTPDDRVRELVKAGALIAAEIDRLLAEGNDDAH